MYWGSGFPYFTSNMFQHALDIGSLIEMNSYLVCHGIHALEGLFQRVLQRKHTFYLQSLGRNIFVHITTENWLERKDFRSKTQNSG